MQTLNRYLKDLGENPPSLDAFLSDSFAVGKELKVWRDWFKTLQKKKELIQYGLGRIASENPGLYSDLQHVSDALDKACAYPIPEKDADLYLE